MLHPAGRMVARFPIRTSIAIWLQVYELLRDNLYHIYKYIEECSLPKYFTIERLREVARQCLLTLRTLHQQAPTSAVPLTNPSLPGLGCVFTPRRLLPRDAKGS